MKKSTVVASPEAIEQIKRKIEEGAARQGHKISNWELADDKLTRQTKVWVANCAGAKQGCQVKVFIDSETAVPHGYTAQTRKCPFTFSAIIPTKGASIFDPPHKGKQKKRKER